MFDSSFLVDTLRNLIIFGLPLQTLYRAPVAFFEAPVCVFPVKLVFAVLSIRLLIDKPQEAHFLSALIKREMIFNLLSGDYGHLFFQHVLFDQKADGVGKAIAWIKENYSRSFTAQELANSSNMSISGLHHKFKGITTMGPLQYQKQLRLQEARRLMLSGSMDATTAALEVGYESPSQFSRKYRRLNAGERFKLGVQTKAA